MIRALVIFGVLSSGILFLSWKEMSAGVPAFHDLQLTEANTFRADFGRDPLLSGGRGSIEFFDKSGHRFQTPRMSDVELNGIKQALERNVPVQIRYGRWLSVFPSSKIFTIYQLEVDGAVVIPYERLALAKQKEQDHKGLIIVLVAVGTCVAVFLGVKIGSRAQRLNNQHATE